MTEKLAYRYLFYTLSRIRPLKYDEKAMIMENSRMMHCPSKTLLLKENDICRHIFFIAKGICRRYFYDNHQECITDMAYEGHFITSYAGIFSGDACFENIEALEDTVVISISGKNMVELKKKFPAIREIFDELIRKHIVEREKTIYYMRKLDALERCRLFFTQPQYKKIKQRVSNKYIASLLQMSPESFSRMKKKVLAGK